MSAGRSVSLIWGLLFLLIIFGISVIVEAQAPSSQPSQPPTSQPQVTTDPSEG